jgi:hypothetical protein
LELELELELKRKLTQYRRQGPVRGAFRLQIRQWWCHQWTTHVDFTELSGILSCTTAVTVTIMTITVSGIAIAITITNTVIASAVSVFEGFLVLLDAICIIEASTCVPEKGDKEYNRSELYDLKLVQ